MSSSKKKDFWLFQQNYRSAAYHHMETLYEDIQLSCYYLDFLMRWTYFASYFQYKIWNLVFWKHQESQTLLELLPTNESRDQRLNYTPAWLRTTETALPFKEASTCPKWEKQSEKKVIMYFLLLFRCPHSAYSLYPYQEDHSMNL